MKFFQVLATVALAASAVSAVEKGISLGRIFGGPHGDKYDDIDRVDPGEVVKSITIRSADRVDYIGLDIVDAAGMPALLEHGGGGGNKDTLTLGDGEHIVGMEAHWGKYYRKTRIMYIAFTTNKGNTIKGGTPQDNTDKIDRDTAPDGYQLGGFMGFSGKEVDSVGCIWTSIAPVV